MAKEYIEREAAIQQMVFVHGRLDERYISESNLLVIPVSDVVERKKGEWKILDECSNEGVYCSICHKKVYRIDYSNTMKLKSNFCPNCGADMRHNT